MVLQQQPVVTMRTATRALSVSVAYAAFMLLCVVQVGATLHPDLRWRAVWLFEDSDYNFLEIASMLYISSSSVRRWVRYFYKHGDVIPRRVRRPTNPMPRAPALHNVCKPAAMPAAAC